MLLYLYLGLLSFHVRCVYVFSRRHYVVYLPVYTVCLHEGNMWCVFPCVNKRVAVGVSVCLCVCRGQYLFFYLSVYLPKAASGVPVCVCVSKGAASVCLYICKCVHSLCCICRRVCNRVAHNVPVCLCLPTSARGRM
jgi:hypothetical protein